MAFESMEKRKLYTPRKKVRYGSAVMIGEKYFMEVKNHSRSDYVTMEEIAEGLTGRKVRELSIKFEEDFLGNI